MKTSETITWNSFEQDQAISWPALLGNGATLKLKQTVSLIRKVLENDLDAFIGTTEQDKKIKTLVIALHSDRLNRLLPNNIENREQKLAWLQDKADGAGKKIAQYSSMHKPTKVSKDWQDPKHLMYENAVTWAKTMTVRWSIKETTSEDLLASFAILTKKGVDVMLSKEGDEHLLNIPSVYALPKEVLEAILAYYKTNSPTSFDQLFENVAPIVSVLDMALKEHRQALLQNFIKSGNIDFNAAKLQNIVSNIVRKVALPMQYGMGAGYLFIPLGENGEPFIGLMLQKYTKDHTPVEIASMFVCALVDYLELQNAALEKDKPEKGAIIAVEKQTIPTMSVEERIRVNKGMITGIKSWKFQNINLYINKKDRSANIIGGHDGEMAHYVHRIPAIVCFLPILSYTALYAHCSLAVFIGVGYGTAPLLGIASNLLVLKFLPNNRMVYKPSNEELQHVTESAGPKRNYVIAVITGAIGGILSFGIVHATHEAYLYLIAPQVFSYTTFGEYMGRESIISLISDEALRESMTKYLELVSLASIVLVSLAACLTTYLAVKDEVNPKGK
ncbi:MAG: hypothetical protein JSS50_01640 [Proteobacteria bacterium]|nr:hypothetical protein [Pseudomonadota bacterium]